MKILDWLMEDDNPSVKYYTMIELLKMSKDHKDCIAIQEEILRRGPAFEILECMHEDGYWEDEEKFYTAKYKGTVWQLLILAELGASGHDERVKKACEFILNRSQSGDGGFSISYSKKSNCGLQSKVIPCLTGNMTYALIKFGYIEDERVRKSIDWILTNQRADDGIKPETPDWLYNKHEACFGHHTCFMGIVKSLKALSVIPENMRSEAIHNKIDELAEFILIHHIHKKSNQLELDSKPGWKKFGFPLMYQTDVLEILEILISLGIKDERMKEAISLLESKQQDSEVYLLENTFNGKTLVSIEEKNKPSKWITLKALKVLNGYYEKN